MALAMVHPRALRPSMRGPWPLAVDAVFPWWPLDAFPWWLTCRRPVRGRGGGVGVDRRAIRAWEAGRRDRSERPVRVTPRGRRRGVRQVRRERARRQPVETAVAAAWDDRD